MLYAILVRLHGMAKAKKTDKYMIRFLQKVKLKDTLFVIDEAHNYFDKRNTVLVWWLSYHRHLYHEIILITQNLALIESKYKSFSEFFYKAQSQSLTLDKRYFTYTVYCSSRMTNDSKSGKIKVKRNPKVFELYHSGDSINSSNIVLKFLLIALAILVVLVVFFKFFIMDKGKKVEEKINSDTKVLLASIPPSSTVQLQKQDEIIEIVDYKEKVFFTLACGINKCSNQDLSIPPLLLKTFMTNKSVKLVYVEKKNNNLHDYYLECSADFYNYLKPKLKEKETNDKDSKKGDFSVNSLLGGSPTSKREH